MKNKLQAALKEALKAKDRIKADTIRSIISAIQYEEIEKKIDNLPEEACLPIVQRELKKRKEEVDYAKQAGRKDLEDKLALEISAIELFLPKQLSPEEVEKILIEMKAQGGASNMGAAMKALKEKYAGQYDSRAASETAKRVFG